MVSYLELAIGGSHLNYPVLVTTHKVHQTAFCAASVRQRGRQMASSIPQTSDGEEESHSHFRERIVCQLTSYLPTNSAQESLSGTTRQV